MPYATGTKTVLTLRKYIDGQPTNETKANVSNDPDYIAPYVDTVDCPISEITTTTTSTTTSTTTTTAAPSLYYTFNACDSQLPAVDMQLSSQPATGARYINSSSQEYYTYDGNVGTQTAENTVVTLNNTGLTGCP